MSDDPTYIYLNLDAIFKIKVVPLATEIDHWVFKPLKLNWYQKIIQKFGLITYDDWVQTSSGIRFSSREILNMNSLLVIEDNKIFKKGHFVIFYMNGQSDVFSYERSFTMLTEIKKRKPDMIFWEIG